METEKEIKITIPAVILFVIYAISLIAGAGMKNGQIYIFFMGMLLVFFVILLQRYRKNISVIYNDNSRTIYIIGGMGVILLVIGVMFYLGFLVTAWLIWVVCQENRIEKKCRTYHSYTGLRRTEAIIVAVISLVSGVIWLFMIVYYKYYMNMDSLLLGTGLSWIDITPYDYLLLWAGAVYGICLILVMIFSLLDINTLVRLYQQQDIGQKDDEVEKDRGGSDRQEFGVLEKKPYTPPADEPLTIREAYEPFHFLTCTGGMYAGIQFPLKGDDFLMIGRDSNASQIVIDKDTRVSRTQCQVRYNAERQCFEVVDCSSVGTYLNGIRIERGCIIQCRKGADIRLGNTEHTFQFT